MKTIEIDTATAQNYIFPYTTYVTDIRKNMDTGNKDTFVTAPFCLFA